MSPLHHSLFKLYIQNCTYRIVYSDAGYLLTLHGTLHSAPGTRHPALKPSFISTSLTYMLIFNINCCIFMVFNQILNLNPKVLIIVCLTKLYIK